MKRPQKANQWKFFQLQYTVLVLYISNDSNNELSNDKGKEEPYEFTFFVWETKPCDLQLYM